MDINQASYWYTGQLVTALQMNDFSKDIYLRFKEITQQSMPCILSLDLNLLTQVGGNVNVPDGSFRFNDTHYAFLPYDIAIFAFAPTEIVAVSGNGFIVARYTVSPTSPDETNYIFSASYLFVASINPATDVIVCTITSGTISSIGKFFNNPYGIPSTPFTFPDGTEIRVNGTDIFPTTQGISVSGHYPGSVGTPYPSGITTINNSLITEGIISKTRGYSNFGSATGGLTPDILATVEFDGTFLKLVVNNISASPIVADIHFSIEI
jgi:hypothetical protein